MYVAILLWRFFDFVKLDLDHWLNFLFWNQQSLKLNEFFDNFFKFHFVESIYLSNLTNILGQP